MNFIFNIFPMMFVLIFVFVIGTFIATAVGGIVEWNKNNNSPRLTVNASIVTKRMDVTHHRHTNAGGNGVHRTTSTRYYVTF